MDHFGSIPDFTAPSLVRIGDMTLDRERRTISRERKAVSAGGRHLMQFWLLFGKYPNQPLPDERIRFAIWGDQVRGREVVRAHVWQCRRALKALRSQCQIVNHNFGTYEFVVPRSARSQAHG